MTINDLLLLASNVWTPLTFAILVGIAAVFIWLAITPSRNKQSSDGRLEGYLRNHDVIEDMQLEQSFWKRAIWPAIRSVLHLFGRFLPGKRLERLQTSIMYAGDPGGLTAHDFTGIQILSAITLTGLYLLANRIIGNSAAMPLIIARNALMFTSLGIVIPAIWLRTRINHRRQQIIRSFSDALDLLSVGVEAGLAFDTAMLRVCDNWDNALTREFRRSHLEMRVGTPRNVALQRMATRMGIQEVSTFIGVLIQSSELGVSIAEVLHSQAEEIRIRRRMRAEELARQASIKMIFALVFLIFPVLLVVLLGPGLPQLFAALDTLGGG